MAVTARSSDRTDRKRENAPRPVPIGVGAELRDARVRRGLSLDQLARTTKIGVAILCSIETNQREKLPAPVFLRGFLRAYAREVGLDPEDTVSRYLRQSQPADEKAETPLPVTSQTPREPTRAAESASDADRRSMRVQWLLVGVLVAIAGFTAIRWRANHPDGAASLASPTESVQSPPPVASASPETLPVTAATGSRDTIIVAADGDALRIEVHPRALCWLAATVDGKRVVYRLMQPGEQQTIEMRDDAVLRIGDPVAFAFSINGAQGRSLGRPGEATTVHITKQNYRDFISP